MDKVARLKDALNQKKEELSVCEDLRKVNDEFFDLYLRDLAIAIKESNEEMQVFYWKKLLAL